VWKKAGIYSGVAKLIPKGLTIFEFVLLATCTPMEALTHKPFKIFNSVPNFEIKLDFLFNVFQSTSR
jgi:hypothetical protein